MEPQNDNYNNQPPQSPQPEPQPTQPLQPTQPIQPITPEQPTPTNLDNPKKKKTKKIILIIVCIILAVFAAVGGILFFVFSNSENMACSGTYLSDTGVSITLYYNDKELVGYTSTNMDYDLSEQKQYAKTIGIQAYLNEFKEMFEIRYDGECKASSNIVSNASKPENNTTPNITPNNNTTTDKNLKTVGDSKYGYITVPNNWTVFHDVDGNSSLQYTYAGVFIVSLNYLDSQLSAREYAMNFSYNMQNSDEVTDVTNATVQIGQNREYTAYQVYMYYPNDNVFLITYWFEAEDGKVHYIALEGPEKSSNIKLSDLVFIPESFSLKP